MHLWPAFLTLRQLGGDDRLDPVDVNCRGGCGEDYFGKVFKIAPTAASVISLFKLLLSMRLMFSAIIGVAEQRIVALTRSDVFENSRELKR